MSGQKSQTLTWQSNTAAPGESLEVSKDFELLLPGFGFQRLDPLGPGGHVLTVIQGDAFTKSQLTITNNQAQETASFTVDSFGDALRCDLLGCTGSNYLWGSKPGSLIFVRPVQVKQPANFEHVIVLDDGSTIRKRVPSRVSGFTKSGEHAFLCSLDKDSGIAQVIAINLETGVESTSSVKLDSCTSSNGLFASASGSDVAVYDTDTDAVSLHAPQDIDDLQVEVSACRNFAGNLFSVDYVQGIFDSPVKKFVFNSATETFDEVPFRYACDNQLASLDFRYSPKGNFWYGLNEEGFLIVGAAGSDRSAATVLTATAIRAIPEIRFAGPNEEYIYFMLAGELFFTSTDGNTTQVLGKPGGNGEWCNSPDSPSSAYRDRNGNAIIMVQGVEEPIRIPTVEPLDDLCKDWQFSPDESI